MFVMEMPELPPEQAAVIVAPTNQMQQGGGANRVMAVCHPVEGGALPPADSRGEYVIAPAAAALEYFHRFEMRDVRQIAAQTTIIEQPKYGKLLDAGTGTYGAYFIYAPNLAYSGKDEAVLLIELATGEKVKVVYYFHVIGDDYPKAGVDYSKERERQYREWEQILCKETEYEYYKKLSLVSPVVGVDIEAISAGAWLNGIDWQALLQSSGIQLRIAELKDGTLGQADGIKGSDIPLADLLSS